MIELGINSFFDFLESNQWIPLIPDEFSMGNWSIEISL